MSIQNAQSEHERHDLPEVNFGAIAQRVIDTRIFQDTKLGNSEYGNGPAAIAHELDPGKVYQRKYNRNFRDSLNVILPPQDFAHFMIGQLQTKLDSTIITQTEQVITEMDTRTPWSIASDELAWNIDPQVIRQSTQGKKEFPGSVLRESSKVMRENPDLALAIALYQVFAHQFLYKVIEQVRAKDPSLGVTEADLQAVLGQFSGNRNFLISVIPAVVTFARKAGEIYPGSAAVFSQNTIKEAIKFIKDAGFFRQDEEVEESVAENGIERIQHFHCPASENVTKTLLKSLAEIYEFVRENDSPEMDKLKMLVSAKYKEG